LVQSSQKLFGILFKLFDVAAGFVFQFHSKPPEILNPGTMGGEK
jgi:hypothetical protein